MEDPLVSGKRRSVSGESRGTVVVNDCMTRVSLYCLRNDMCLFMFQKSIRVCRVAVLDPGFYVGSFGLGLWDYVCFMYVCMGFGL